MSAYLQRLFDRAASLPPAATVGAPSSSMSMPTMVFGSPILAFDQRLTGVLGQDFNVLGVSPEAPGGPDAWMTGALADPAPDLRPDVRRAVDAAPPPPAGSSVEEGMTRRSRAVAAPPKSVAGVPAAPVGHGPTSIVSAPPTVGRAAVASDASRPAPAPAPSLRSGFVPVESAPPPAAERAAPARPARAVVERAAGERSLAVPITDPTLADASRRHAAVIGVSASADDRPVAQVARATPVSSAGAIPEATPATPGLRPQVAEPAASTPPPLRVVPSEVIDRRMIERIVRETVRAESASRTPTTAPPSSTAERERTERPTASTPRTAHEASVIGALEVSRRPLTLFGVRRR